MFSFQINAVQIQDGVQHVEGLIRKIKGSGVVDALIDIPNSRWYSAGKFLKLKMCMLAYHCLAVLKFQIGTLLDNWLSLNCLRLKMVMLQMIYACVCPRTLLDSWISWHWSWAFYEHDEWSMPRKMFQIETWLGSYFKLEHCLINDSHWISETEDGHVTTVTDLIYALQTDVSNA